MRPWRRSAERRRSAISVLRAVAAAVPSMRDVRQLRRRFEEELRGLLDARTIELRDGPPTPTPLDASMSLEISAGAMTLGALDVALGPDPDLDGWDAQVLQDARHVAAFVLMLERAFRAGMLPTPRHRFDGAAPIIGSSAAIRAVRERIDRVAATNFTVLIEGPIRR